MFFPDKVQGYREARRVLQPGGRFLFNVWDEIAENEFADVVTQALAELFPHDPPRFMARTPHGYHDRAAIARELAAGRLRRRRRSRRVDGTQPGRLAARAGDRLLPGNAAAQRDRGARCVGAWKQRRRRRRQAALRHWSDRRPHARARDCRRMSEPHPEEARSAVSKGGLHGRGGVPILRDARYGVAPQDEVYVVRLPSGIPPARYPL